MTSTNDTEMVNRVHNMYKSDKVVIFSKTYCPYCTMAKDVSPLINRFYLLGASEVISSNIDF